MSAARSGRPSFIPRDKYREHLRASELNKIVRVGGMQCGSYIARCARLGKPIKVYAGAFGEAKRYRLLDVHARASAEGEELTPPFSYQAARAEEYYRERLAIYEAEIEKIHELSKFNKIARALTNGTLLTTDQIVAAAEEYPETSGVYFLVDAGAVVYVGQSVNVFVRVGAHHRDKIFDSVAYIGCEVALLDVYESLYIHQFQPKYNGGEGRNVSAPLGIKEISRLAVAARLAEREHGKGVWEVISVEDPADVRHRGDLFQQNFDAVREALRGPRQ